MAIIQTNKLTKYYLGRKVLGVKDLSLEINEGEVFGFIGPNGAGKSTTIRLLLDLIRPTSGDGKIFGLDMHLDTVKIKEEVGYLPGEVFLQENMTGKNCVDYYSKFKKSIDKKYLQTLLERLDLNLNKKVREYSKGNKQKLAIILAMMHKPKLLILDEPTSGLDPLNQQTFYDLILETKKWNTTTFLSTHILEEAQRICDRVGIIKSGQLLKIEDIDDFKEKNVREVIIETSESIPLSKFTISGVKKVTRSSTGYNVTTVGKNGPLMKEILRNSNVDDIRITEPSLEEIFMKYYKE
jgi:ABC-2 type transport system ATP-binding protein